MGLQQSGGQRLRFDDVSLQAIEEPPLAVSTPLDEYYLGETIQWIVTASASGSQAQVRLLSANQLMAEQTGQIETGRLRGAFETTKLKPGIYTLKATLNSPQKIEQAAQCQILLAPAIFDSWKQ